MLIERGGVWRGDWVVGFLAWAEVVGIFADDGGVLAELAGGVFDLDDAGEVLLVGVVHLHGGLPEAFFAGDGFTMGELLRGEVFMFETQRTIGQGTEAVVEVFVHRSGVDHVLVFHVGQDFAIAGVEEEAQFVAAGRHHALEHPGVSGLGQCLEFLAQVAVVAVGADGDAAADAGVEVLGMALPLFQGVALEEFFIQLPADLGNDDLLGVGGVFDRHPLFREPGLHLLAGGFPADELLEGVEVDGEFPVSPIGVGEDLIVHRMPVGELRQVVADARGIGAEIMRPVGVDQHAVVVVAVIGVAADVRAFLDDKAALAMLGAEAFRGGETGKTGSDDQVVEVPGHGGEQGDASRETRAGRREQGDASWETRARRRELGDAS